MAEQALQLAMLGMGTVGTGVARLLTQRPEHLRTLGVGAVHFRTVLLRDLKKARSIELAGTKFTERFEDIAKDPAVDIVIEVMGGIEPARTYVVQSLRAGKHVVTANKALLAEHGPELFQIAAENDRSILFEASVAGGVPILAAVAETLCINRIQLISAILNGTCNYILSQMHQSALPYEEALAQAQALGFAEADPTLDVNGTDAAQKLALLARLAFQTHVDWRKIPVVGIDRISPVDIAFAQELGYVIRLLAEGQVTGDRLHLQVSPKLIHHTQPLAQIRGEYNAIRVVGDAVGDLLFSGKGAGEMPTASSVAAGVIDLATGRGQQTFRSLKLWDTNPPGPRFDPDASQASRFYLRYTIQDRPGTLAKIAGILGAHGISISSVIQHETAEGDAGGDVPLIIMTHEAPEGQIRRAVAEADQQLLTRTESICFPVAPH